MLFGYFFAPYISEILNPMVDSFRDRVQQGDIKITHDSIFFNNVFVGIMMYCGAVAFGLLTAITLITNGIFIGYFATQMPLYAFLLYTLPHGIFEIPAIIIAGCSGFVLFKFIAATIYNIISPNHLNFNKIDNWDGDSSNSHDLSNNSSNNNSNNNFNNNFNAHDLNDDFVNNLSIKDRIISSLNSNIDKLVQSLSLFGVSVVLFIIAAFIEAYLTISIANLFI